VQLTGLLLTNRILPVYMLSKFNPRMM